MSHINVQYSKKKDQTSCSGLRKEARHPRAARREGIAFDSQAIETQIQSNRYALLTLEACINFESTSDCFVCPVRLPTSEADLNLLPLVPTAATYSFGLLKMGSC